MQTRGEYLDEMRVVNCTMSEIVKLLIEICPDRRDVAAAGVGEASIGSSVMRPPLSDSVVAAEVDAAEFFVVRNRRKMPRSSIRRKATIPFPENADAVDAVGVAAAAEVEAGASVTQTGHWRGNNVAAAVNTHRSIIPIAARTVD